MRQTLRGWFSIGTVALGLGLVWGWGPAAAAPSPADPDSILVADEWDTCVLGGRTPLIVIHGLHGNQVAGVDDIGLLNRDYFGPFLAGGFYHSAGPVPCTSDPTRPLFDRYKVYRFHYVSDAHTVSEIGHALANAIAALDDAGGVDSFADREIVLLAHSMGGLVARSFMTEWLTESANSPTYAGLPAGARVSRLLTLATPHHGSPGANWQAPRALMPSNSWRDAFTTVDGVFWSGTPNAQHPELVNRAGLRYDDYDGVFGATNCGGTPCYDIPTERNEWLLSLNADTTYDDKLLAYLGFLDPFAAWVNTDPNRAAIMAQVNSFLGSPSVTLPLYAATGCSLILNCNGSWEATDPDPETRRAALVASILMSEGTQSVWPWNDGLVTRESGAFVSHTPAGRLTFRGYDHGEMLVGRPQGNGALFAAIERDLLGLGGPEILWVNEPPEAALGGTPVPMTWRLSNFTGPVTQNQAHFGITSVLGSSPELPGTNGIHTHTFTAPNVGAFDSPRRFAYIIRALDGGAQHLSPVAWTDVYVGAAPPAVAWVTPPPASAPSGGQFTVQWQLTNYADAVTTNAAGWGVTNILGQTPDQPGGNATYSATIDLPVVGSPGTLYFTAFAANAIEFAFASIAPVQITVP